VFFFVDVGFVCASASLNCFSHRPLSPPRKSLLPYTPPIFDEVRSAPLGYVLHPVLFLAPHSPPWAPFIRSFFGISAPRPSLYDRAFLGPGGVVYGNVFVVYYPCLCRPGNGRPGGFSFHVSPSARLCPGPYLLVSRF